MTADQGHGREKRLIDRCGGAEGVFFAWFGYHVPEHGDGLREQLATPEAQNADRRVVFAHWPRYSCGRYSINEAGGSGTTKIFDDGNVDVYFCGHEHHYERTAVMYENRVVTKSSDIDKNSVRGTLHFVTGGGGVSTREVNPNERTVYAQSIHHFCEVDVTPGQLRVIAKDINGSVIDEVTLLKASSSVLARFSATPLSGPLPFEVSVDAAGSLPSTGLSYFRDFGDATAGSGSTTTHVYPEVGTYKIVLTVAADGQSDSDTVSVRVFDPAYEPVCISTGATVTVSSEEKSIHAAPLAVDGDMSTRWSSEYSDPQWIIIDLGSVKQFDQIKLHWEAAYATAYTIDVSNDNSSWTTIHTETSGDGGEDVIDVQAEGRYVRLTGTQRATEWGYSLYEFEVWQMPNGSTVAGGYKEAPVFTGPPTFRRIGSLQRFEGDQLGSVRLFAANGNMVAEGVAAGRAVRVDVGNLSQGVYVARCRAGGRVFNSMLRIR